MDAFFPQTSLILVAVMPELRDLEIARVLGWYRIPLRFAPKVIDVDYLLFYQTKAFGANHHGCIEYSAEVEGHELVQRKDLFREALDHPRANEEYYKIQLGKLRPMPNVIKADKWRRITFFYTTGGLANSAKIVNDLVVKDDERKILWRSLRERGLQSGDYHNKKQLEEQENLIDIEDLIGGLSQLGIGDTEW